MIGDLLYSVEVEVIRYPGETDDGISPGISAEQPMIVRYCDVCRRWGTAGSTHMCWHNWHPRLSDLLIDMARDGRRP